MPARLSLLALIAIALAATASAQSATPLQFAALPAATAPASPVLDRYAGYYAADGGAVEVRAEGDHLTLIAYGAPVAGRLAPLAPKHPAIAERARALLDAWVTDDLASLVAAVAPEQQAEAAESFASYRGALVRGHGPAIAASVTGTFRQPDGRQVTLAQVLFERGSEWVSLVWKEDGSLATMTRGLSAAIVGTVRPTGTDTFDGAGLHLTFQRDADGRIGRIAIDNGLVATR